MAETQVNSVLKAISIMNLFAYEGKTLGITEISHKLSLQKANVYKIVKTLERLGWLEQELETNRYRIGIGFLRAAGAALSHSDDRQSYLEEMQNISETINEDVVLCTIINDEFGWCLERVGSENSLVISTRRNDRVILNRGASGKIMLAYQSEEFIQREYNANQQYLHKSLEEFLADLREIRTQGYSVTKEELDEGVCAVAVPVFEKNGQFVYSLSVAGPIKRIESKDIPHILSLLKIAAKSISMQIQYCNT